MKGGIQVTNIAYSEAATEVLAILDNTDEEAVNKIPKKFIKFLEQNSSKTYKPEFDDTKPIKELNLKPKTEALLGLIYLKYWADEEEKMAFKKKVKENEIKYQKKLREKYNIDNLFTKNTTIEKKSENIQETAMTQMKEEKIENIIKRVFRR